MQEVPFLNFIVDHVSMLMVTEDELGNWRPERNRFSKSYFTAYRFHMPPAEPAEDYDDRNALYALQADPFNC